MLIFENKNNAAQKQHYDWEYIGALYFVFTIITTIGYGTFAPQTNEGRFITVLVGVVGIGKDIAMVGISCYFFMNSVLVAMCTKFFNF